MQPEAPGWKTTDLIMRGEWQFTPAHPPAPDDPRQISGSHPTLRTYTAMLFGCRTFAQEGVARWSWTEWSSSICSPEARETRAQKSYKHVPTFVCNSLPKDNSAAKQPAGAKQCGIGYVNSSKLQAKTHTQASQDRQTDILQTLRVVVVLELTRRPRRAGVAPVPVLARALSPVRCRTCAGRASVARRASIARRAAVAGRGLVACIVMSASPFSQSTSAVCSRDWIGYVPPPPLISTGCPIVVVSSMLHTFTQRPVVAAPGSVLL